MQQMNPLQQMNQMQQMNQLQHNPMQQMNQMQQNPIFENKKKISSLQQKYRELCRSVNVKIGVILFFFFGFFFLYVISFLISVHSIKKAQICCK